MTEGVEKGLDAKAALAAAAAALFCHNLLGATEGEGAVLNSGS